MIREEVISALRYETSAPRVLTLPDISRAELHQLADRIAGADPVQFHDIPLEPTPGRPGAFKPPQLTVDEKGFFVRGLIPLPAPATWLEFSLNRCRSGLLVEEEGSGWRFHRFDLFNGVVAFDGSTTLVRRELTETNELVSEISGSEASLDMLRDHGGVMVENAAGTAYFGIYLVLMMNSRTVDRERVKISEALQRARRRRGQPQLADHTVIRIVPARFTRATDSAGRSHASPRLHWRRSHLRRYDHATPAATWKEDEGKWCVVVPRCLVGRAELGEISHEYFVAGGRDGRA